MTVQLGDDFTIEVCGRRFVVSWSIETLRRAEQAVGAVVPWANRLDIGDVRIREIAAVYRAILIEEVGGPSIPTEEELVKWAYARGVVNHGDLAVFLYSLTMGKEEIARVRRWQQLQESVLSAAASAPRKQSAEGGSHA